MTLTPPMSLEQALVEHGNALYRMALLLTGNEVDAAQVLRATSRCAAQTPTSIADATELLALLLTTVHQRAEDNSFLARVRRLRLPRLRVGDQQHFPNELYRTMLELPLDQRQMLGLILLLGYDMPTAAHISGMAEDQACKTLNAALLALATTGEIASPDTTPTDLCPPVRTSLMSAAANPRHDPALRGHLALCSACRAFEKAWKQLIQRVEYVLRGTLRNYALSPDLRTELVNDVFLPHRRQRRLLQFALLPLLALLFIALTILPGLFRHPVTQEIQAPTLEDPRNLVERALAQVDQPPAGQGTWHGQWEIAWYFSDGSYAPLQADAWIDTQNPARHRLQFTHSDGGAPYELQLGDGTEELWYALHPAYYGSLYGGQSIDSPRLIHRAMATDQQDQARAARLRSGVWDVGPSYLRQAAAASDLRTLGQQPDGNHTVQIISFSGFSPLGLPPDAPGTTSSRIPILLAIDIATGQLRSATELLGPTGGAQTSRITWRLRSEEWVGTGVHVRPIFNVKRAWTGKGDFSKQTYGVSADNTLLLLEKDTLVHPAQLLNTNLWLPGKPPPGAERALLRWGPPELTYLGPGRWLTLIPVTRGFATGGDSADVLNLEATGTAPQTGNERVQIAPWTIDLRAGKGQRYYLTLQRDTTDDRDNDPAPARDTVTMMLIKASGYTRAELLQVIRNLRPFDPQSFLAQEHLFAAPDEL